MDLSPIFKAVLDVKHGGDGLAGQALKVGDRLSGRVLKIEADGKIIIDLGRFRASARIGFPVKAGQALQLKVVKGGSPLHLQADVKDPPRPLLNVPRLDFSQLFTLQEHKQFVHLVDRLANLSHVQWDRFPFSSPVREAMGHIKGIFDSIPVNKPTDQLAKHVKATLEDRGVLFEKKMADAVAGSALPGSGKETKANQVRAIITQDLKPQLMILKTFLESSAPLEMFGARLAEDELALVRHGVSKMLDHVVQQQERAVRNIREGELFQIFTHMLSFDEQKQPVQFKVFYPKRGGRDNSDPHHHIALLLNMGRLGPVRVDLSMVERHLNVRFFVQNTAVQGHFERHMKGLNAVLGAMFDEVVMVTRVSEEKIRQFDRHQHEESPLGRIDIKV